MATALSRPEKESYTLVTFYHGALLASQEKYTDWDQAVPGYQSEPRMSVELPANTGSFDQKEQRVILPLDAWTTAVSNGQPFSAIYVEITEVTQGLFSGDQGAEHVVFQGRVVRSIQNFQGMNGRVGIFSLPLKSRLDIPMGIPANHHCALTLGVGKCGAAPVGIVAQVASQDATENTVVDSAITTPGTTDARYWQRGYIEKDGLRITIRSYDGDTDITKIYTTRALPADWIGTNVTFFPGCDKTVETCRARWNSESTFLGMGYAIPAYQPNFQKP